MNKRYSHNFIFDCITCLLGLCMVFVSCSDYEAFYTYNDNDSTNIVINAGYSMTKAVDNSVTINDLTVYVFDSNGNTIGWGYQNYTSSPSTYQLTIKSRKANNCTIYAVANGTQILSIANRNKIPNKAEFDNLYYNYGTLSNIQNETDHILFGKNSGFNTDNGTASLSLSRLYSTYKFNIKINNDQSNQYGIVMDSYQLCNLPTGIYISGTKKSENYVDDNLVAISSGNESGSTVTFTKTILSNYLDKGTNDNTRGWGDRSSRYAPSGASYLEIKCHSQLWTSTYYYYLGGKTQSSTYNSAYDYTDYSIYPNCNYTANIEINGNGASEDGSRVSTIIQSIKESDLGRVICTDATIYDTVSDAQAAGKEPIGMIGYVGPNTGNSTYNHGLVFALENAGDVTQGDYDTAVEFAKTYKSAALKFSSGWHIPTQEEWCRMFEAFGGTQYKEITEDMMIDIGDGLSNVDGEWLYGDTMKKMEDAGGEPFHNGSNYAAKTYFMGKEGFWVYSFSQTIWGWRTNKYNRAVRLCFAF